MSHIRTGRLDDMVVIDPGPAFPGLIGLTPASARGLASDLLYYAELVEYPNIAPAVPSWPIGLPETRSPGTEGGPCRVKVRGRKVGKP